MDKIEQHFEITTPNESPVDVLQRTLPTFSRQKIKAVMQSGCVWLTRGQQTSRLRRASKDLQIGDTLHLYFEPTIFQQAISPPKLIADRQAYSVWYKPSGMFSQGTKWGDANSLARWVSVNGIKDRPAFQIHRLDKATQGLTLIGHSKSATQQLARLFELREIEKHYVAIVDGLFDPTNLSRRLKSSEQNAIIQLDFPVNGKPATTRIVSFEYDKYRDKSQLRVAIDTGRKHQIRRHLAQIGYPIIGDRLYGNKPIDFLDDVSLDEDSLDAVSFDSDENATNAARQNSSQPTLPDLQLAAVMIKFLCPLKSQPVCFEVSPEF